MTGTAAGQKALAQDELETPSVRSEAITTMSHAENKTSGDVPGGNPAIMILSANPADR
jgi:hypothetical protein